MRTFKSFVGFTAALLAVSCTADEPSKRSTPGAEAEPERIGIGATQFPEYSDRTSDEPQECSGSCSQKSCKRTEPRTEDPGQCFTLTLAACQQAELDDVENERATSESMTAEDLLVKYPSPSTNSLPYDPLASQYLDLIESKIGLGESTKLLLAENGFVIRNGSGYDTFGKAYDSLYNRDLPVYVSADAILHAVHRSYQTILKWTESSELLPAILSVLNDMRDALESGACDGFDPATCADVDEYLAVALSLVNGCVFGPVRGGDLETVRSFVNAANEAAGLRSFVLFGTKRTEDMSRFKPRGHYANSVELSQYFRAMMWLGLIDFRMLETDGETGSQVFRPRTVSAVFAVRRLLGDAALAELERVDSILRAFVSEQDNMTLGQVDDLLHDLGDVAPEAAAGMDHRVLAEAIARGGYGQQRIASSIVVNHKGTELPLTASFRMMGQRFTVDSEVFTQVTWARTAEMRTMASPLDAAFAAWGNNGAAQLLLPELEAYSYAPNLHIARYLAEEHAQSFWDSGLYHGWLGALGGLSLSPEEVAAPLTAGMPSVAGTEAWNRRILNTQLASWSELRHNTVLYNKQSGPDDRFCSFPDAYVDPYPEFFERLGDYARRGLSMVEAFHVPGATHFANLADVAARLGAIAQAQRRGEVMTPDELSWINKMIRIQIDSCTGVEKWDGWYVELFADKSNAQIYEPTITDVHSDPNGHVLHVGTGTPKLIIVTVDTGSPEPRAFVGCVSSFYEHITTDYQRLTDTDWRGMVAKHSAPPWFASLTD